MPRMALFATSALLLGFSGLWSVPLIVQENDGVNTVQQHLESFVQESRNVRKRRNDEGAPIREAPAVQHFETQSRTRMERTGARGYRAKKTSHRDQFEKLPRKTLHESPSRNVAAKFKTVEGKSTKTVEKEEANNISHRNASLPVADAGKVIYIRPPKKKKKMTSAQKRALDKLKSMYSTPHYLVQKPTHHACEGYKGILLIQSGDQGAAAGTAFFQYVINQLIYAENYHLLPWIHFNNVSQHIYDPVVHGGVNTTVKSSNGLAIRWFLVKYPNGSLAEGMHFPASPYSTGDTPKATNVTVSGTGVWEHYFEPISEFRKGDKSCEQLPIITMTYPQLQGMHLYAPWAVRSWQYKPMPHHYKQKDNETLHQWFEPMRQKAHEIVQKYYRFQPHIIETVDKILPDKDTCLGLHIRHSDKWGARRQIPQEEFLPYAKSFIENGGKTIYLATDSQNVIDAVRTKWPLWIRKHVKTQGDDSVVRSTLQKPVFKIGEHHRTNTEALTEILALSKCRWMVHGLSAVSESAIYLNLDLHNRSVNLEDPSHWNALEFGVIVRKDLKHHETKRNGDRSIQEHL